MIASLRQLAKTPTGNVGTAYKQALSASLYRIRKDIVKAADYRRSQSGLSFEERKEALTRDIQNVPSHVFGEHKHCAALLIFVTANKKTEK